jgi:hypothetical protein
MRVNIRIEELLTSSTGTTTAAATTGFQTYEEKKNLESEVMSNVVSNLLHRIYQKFLSSLDQIKLHKLRRLL